MTLEEIDKIKINFILGVERSGTSILNKKLNEYRQIHCLPEVNFLLFFLSTYKHLNKFTNDDINILFSQIELYASSHPWIGWSFNITEVKNKILQPLFLNSIKSYEELCKVIFKEFNVVGADKKNASILIDKNPSYIFYINEINQYFKKSKFIFIVRDCRAVVLSHKESVVGNETPDILHNSYKWKKNNETMYNFYSRNKEKCLLISYEDFVLHNQSCLTKIEEFLGIDPNFEHIEFKEKQNIDFDIATVNKNFKKRFIKKYSDLNKPINADRLNSWEQRLDYKEILCCDFVCFPYAEKFGYKTKQEISFTKKLSLRFTISPLIFLFYLIRMKHKILYYLPVKIKLKRLMQQQIKYGFMSHKNN